MAQWLAHDWLWECGCSRDRVDDVEAHLDAAVRVVVARFWQSRHAVVAVAEDLDAQTVVVLRQLVKACKQLVEHLNELLRRALGAERREATDVGEQNTAPTHTARLMP